MRYRPCRNVIIPTQFGMMMVNRFDYNHEQNFPGVSYHLMNTGLENIDSVPILREFLKDKKHPVVIDVGANIGTFTVQVAKILEESEGVLYAFEPQRQIFQMLNGNLALNSIDNVFTFQYAVGNKTDKITIPKVNYYQPASFGSIGLKDDFGDIGQELDFGNGEKVPLVTLDTQLNHLENIDVIKIDVEGMEKEVVEGSLNIIRKHRPLIYLEYIKQPNEGKDISDLLQSLNYIIYKKDINFLCIPQEKQSLPEYSFQEELRDDD